MPAIPPRRSLLFAPASRPELLAKALRADADIVCADLEDAVGAADKDGARGHGIEFLLGAEPLIERALRINSLSTSAGLRDMLALQETAVAGGIVCLP
ncbi:MAG: hypothetical protein JSW68_09255 [Burkholderiales bacterium]|nr:MAG: hypothetical protein JSW68_09255 [Burkholderiales bacterium]